MENNTQRRKSDRRKKETAPSGGGRVFVQTIFCIFIIFYVLFGGTHELPIGQTVMSFTKDTVSRNTDISAWFSLVRSEVEKRLGASGIPENTAEKSFTEAASYITGEAAAFTETAAKIDSGGER